MKKFKKGVVIRRLRRLLSEYCHLRDKKCQRCHRTSGKLDTSHIFPKGHYPSMQFLTENVKLLCFQCHRRWHEHPIWATFWIKQYLGEARYNALIEISKTTKTVDRVFLEETEINLKEKIAELTEALND